MQRNEIAILEQILDAVCLLDLRRQAPRRVHGNVRVVAHDLHAQTNSGIGHQASNSTQTHNTQRTSAQFDTGKVFLAFLNLAMQRSIIAF